MKSSGNGSKRCINLFRRGRRLSIDQVVKKHKIDPPPWLTPLNLGQLSHIKWKRSGLQNAYFSEKKRESGHPNEWVNCSLDKTRKREGLVKRGQGSGIQSSLNNEVSIVGRRQFVSWVTRRRKRLGLFSKRETRARRLKSWVRETPYNPENKIADLDRERTASGDQGIRINNEK